MQQDLKLVTILVIDDKEVKYDDLPPAKAAEIIGKIMDKGMASIGFQRKKTA